MFELISGIFLAYFLLLLIIYIGYKKSKILSWKVFPPVKQKFTILIPYKNEEKNLAPLIHSLNKLNYKPENFEVLFINNNSTDNGTKLIKEKIRIPHRLLDSTKESTSPKKEALEIGMKEAKFNFIITTDADCEVPENWLQAFNSLIQDKKPKMILGPVKYKNEITFIGQFQIIEFLGLQAFTVGSLELGYPFLSNAANLGFEKESFFMLGGYEGNKHIASGDDVFLMEKFKNAYPNDIHYLKSEEAIVQTETQDNWDSLFNQKIRWASKSKAIKNRFGQISGGIIVLTNFFSLILYALIWFYPLFGLGLLGTKFLFEILLTYQTNNFFENKIKFNYFIISFLSYPFYSVLIILGLNKKKYIWKGNKYNT